MTLSSEFSPRMRTDRLAPPLPRNRFSAIIMQAIRRVSEIQDPPDDQINAHWILQIGIVAMDDLMAHWREQ